MFVLVPGGLVNLHFCSPKPHPLLVTIVRQIHDAFLEGRPLYQQDALVRLLHPVPESHRTVQVRAGHERHAYPYPGDLKFSFNSDRQCFRLGRTVIPGSIISSTNNSETNGRRSLFLPSSSHDFPLHLPIFTIRLSTNHPHRWRSFIT